MVRVSKLGTQWRRVTPRRQNMRRIVSLGETRLRVTRNPIFCHPLPNAGCHDLGVFDGVFDKVVPLLREAMSSENATPLICRASSSRGTDEAQRASPQSRSVYGPGRTVPFSNHVDYFVFCLSPVAVCRALAPVAYPALGSKWSINSTSLMARRSSLPSLKSSR